MKAYKGFNMNESGQLVCQDMVYEVGKTYKHEGKIELYMCGYHACEKFEDVLGYYPYVKGKTRYYKVECNGEIIKADEDSKFVCSEITLLEELHGWWEEYDCVEGMGEEPAWVELNGKLNYRNQEGRLLSNQWFDYVWDFCAGFALVKLNGKCNFINTEGKLLSNQWFDGGGEFHDGFAWVYLNRKSNYINMEGKLLSNQWFDGVCYFLGGFAAVLLDGKWNFLNQEGKFLSNQWFDDIEDFHEGFAPVKLNDKWYKLDMEGNLHNV